MMEWLPESDEKILAGKQSGLITSADYETFMPGFLEALAKAQPARMFVDITELEGYEDESARSQRFWFRSTHAGAFERVAFVGPSRWRAEVADLETAWPMSEVQLFDPEERDEAWNWLRRD